MKNDEFQHVLNEQMETCRNVLAGKAEEYASDIDRLSNFKRAAHLKNITQAQALTGMMAKHTVSVYDMVESDAYFTMAEWEEKIGDHLNYLFLLKAVVVEEANNRAQAKAIPSIETKVVDPDYHPH